MGALRVVVTTDNQYRIGATALVAFASLYALTNSLNLGTPVELSPLWIEDNLPLLPATVWVYASFLPLSVAAFVLEKDCVQLTRFVYSQSAVNLLSTAFFVLLPTTFVRPELAGPDSVSLDALRLIWFLDAPVNCLPSLHVSSILVSVLMLWSSRHRAWPFFALWALAVTLSTMTTKQHHIADVLAGALIAVCAYWIFFVQASYQARPQPAQAPVTANH